MAQSKTFQHFSGTRARFQRLRDAMLFNGWVEQFDGRHLTLTTSTDRAFHIDEVAQFEIAGFNAKAVFQAGLTNVDLASFNDDCDISTAAGASVVHVRSCTLRFDVTGQLRISPSSESARIRVNGVCVKFLLPEGRIVTGELSDTSSTGMGVTTDGEMGKGEAVKFAIDTHLGSIGGQGFVVYCRPDPEHDGVFRVGIRLEEMGRLDGPRWHRFLSEMA